jgi:hypothetical protein
MADRAWPISAAQFVPWRVEAAAATGPFGPDLDCWLHASDSGVDASGASDGATMLGRKVMARFGSDGPSGWSEASRSMVECVPCALEDQRVGGFCLRLYSWLAQLE